MLRGKAQVFVEVERRYTRKIDLAPREPRGQLAVQAERCRARGQAEHARRLAQELRRENARRFIACCIGAGFYDNFHAASSQPMTSPSHHQPVKNEFQRRLERLRLSESDFEEHFSRSSGPGGQHVNKVSTAVTLRCPRLNVSVTVQDSRSQAMNRQIARERLLDAIEAAIKARRDENRSAMEKTRRQNRKRPRGLKERILESKKRRSGVKKMRSRVDD